MAHLVITAMVLVFCHIPSPEVLTLLPCCTMFLVYLIFITTSHYLQLIQLNLHNFLLITIWFLLSLMYYLTCVVFVEFQRFLILSWYLSPHKKIRPIHVSLEPLVSFILCVYSLETLYYLCQSNISSDVFTIPPYFYSYSQ